MDFYFYFKKVGFCTVRKVRPVLFSLAIRLWFIKFEFVNPTFVHPYCAASV